MPDPTQKALITGASSGIGAATARRMAARGVEVILAARRADRLDAEVQAIVAAGGRARAVAIDVSRPDETARQVEQLDADVGGLDVVVANAGIGGAFGPISRCTWSDVQRVFNTNLVGAMATLMPVVPRMIARFKESGRRGHLVGVSSLAAELPIPLGCDYAASKAALTFLLDGMQGDLPARGVDVTIVHPGFVKSDMTAKNKFPMPFLVELDDAARIIDDGIARRAARIRFPLGLIAIMGVGKAAPRAVKNRIVSRRGPKPAA